MEEPIGRWLIMIALLLAGALFSYAQGALKYANEGKIRDAAEADKRLRALARRLEDPRALISLRGLKTLSVMLLTALGTMFFAGTLWQGALFCLIATPLVMIVCSLAPERLARRQADSLVIRLRHVIMVACWVMGPLSWLMDAAARGLSALFGVSPQAPEEEVTEEGIRAMVDIGEESGIIESEEREMIENVFEFGDLTAADCMTHRTNVTAIWIDDDEQTILDTIRETGLSRFPVYNEDIDDIVGVLATRDYLLNASQDQPLPLRQLLREAYFVPETVKTDVLLRNMQIAKTHLAIVVDEYGGVSGLITMEDLLEEIVGNIYDEFDPTDETEIQPLGADQWRVSGAVELDTLSEVLQVKAPQEQDYDTLGGWIFSQFSTIPEDGATPQLTLYCTEDGQTPEKDGADRLEIRVEKIEDHRIAWALVTLKRKETDADEGERED